MKAPRPSKFAEPISARRRTTIAAATVMLASLATLVPFVAPLPLLPPCGLLMLLGWRLRSPDVLPVWGAAPLGLFDDLFSGQPFGSAMALWTLALISIDIIDNRLVWRDFWQDWLIAGGGIATFLVVSRLAGTPIDGSAEPLAHPWAGRMDSSLLRGLGFRPSVPTIWDAAAHGIL